MYAHGIDLTLMIDDVRIAYERRGFRARTAAFSYTTPPQGPSGGSKALFSDDLLTSNDSIFVWCGVTGYLLDTEHGGSSGVDAAVFASLEIMGPRYRLAGPFQEPWTAFSGSAMLPHLFAFPILLVPGERVRVEWIDLEEAFDHATFSLIGAKLWTTPYTAELIYPQHDETIVFPEALRR